MEKIISTKHLDVLYYDGKLLPVTLERKDNKKYVRFLIKNVNVEIENLIYDSKKHNSGALGMLILKAPHQETRYAEIGSLLSAICNYGSILQNNFTKFYRIREIVKGDLAVTEEEKAHTIQDYFNTNLNESEIKSLFQELNKGYKLQNKNERIN